MILEVIMAQSENNPSLTPEILKQRFDNHREYVSRQWQYYATFILLNGLLINAVKDLGAIDPLLVTALGLAFVTTSAVFFHLINWTKMRIHRNAVKINGLAGQSLIEIPKWHEGIAPWLLFSILIFTICWLIWLFRSGWVALLLGVFLFVFIVGNSFVSTVRWEKRT
jgi:hypothetical protein